MDQPKQFYCSDCREFNGWENQDMKLFETCNFCGKQGMCVDATGMELNVKERPLDDLINPEEKKIFAKIIELKDRQVVLTKNYDPDHNIWYLKGESDYGVGRYAVTFADKKNEGIDKLFDDFSEAEAQKMVDHVKAQLKSQKEELDKMEEDIKNK